MTNRLANFIRAALATPTLWIEEVIAEAAKVPCDPDADDETQLAAMVPVIVAAVQRRAATKELTERLNAEIERAMGMDDRGIAH